MPASHRCYACLARSSCGRRISRISWNKSPPRRCNLTHLRTRRTRPWAYAHFGQVHNSHFYQTSLPPPRASSTCRLTHSFIPVQTGISRVHMWSTSARLIWSLPNARVLKVAYCVINSIHMMAVASDFFLLSIFPRRNRDTSEFSSYRRFVFI